MSDEKKFPPRRAYSLREAAEELGCSVEALLDWGNQKFIKVCLKVTEKTHIGKLESDHYRWGDPGLEPEKYPCAIGTKIYESYGNSFDVGDAFVMMQSLTKEKSIELGFGVYGSKDQGVDIYWLCNILGFWEVEGGHLFSLTESQAKPPVTMLLQPYGMTDEEKAERGKCSCTASIALGVDDLVLMRPEFEKLRNYTPNTRKDSKQAQADEGETNRFGVGRPSFARQEYAEDAFLIAKAVKDKYPEVSRMGIAKEIATHHR